MYVQSKAAPGANPHQGGRGQHGGTSITMIMFRKPQKGRAPRPMSCTGGVASKIGSSSPLTKPALGGTTGCALTTPALSGPLALTRPKAGKTPLPPVRHRPSRHHALPLSPYPSAYNRPWPPPRPLHAPTPSDQRIIRSRVASRCSLHLSPPPFCLPGTRGGGVGQNVATDKKKRPGGLQPALLSAIHTT